MLVSLVLQPPPTRPYNYVIYVHAKPSSSSSSSYLPQSDYGSVRQEKKEEKGARGWGARVCVCVKARRTWGMVHERMNVHVNTLTDVS